MSVATSAASEGGASWAGGATNAVAEGEGNNADTVINKGHNDHARNTTTLQMLKTRDLIVCLFSFIPITVIVRGRINCSAM